MTEYFASSANPFVFSTAPLCLIVSRNGNKHWTGQRVCTVSTPIRQSPIHFESHDSICHYDPTIETVLRRHSSVIEIPKKTTHWKQQSKSSLPVTIHTVFAQAPSLHQARRKPGASTAGFQYIQLQGSYKPKLSPSSILLTNHPAKISGSHTPLCRFARSSSL